MINIFVRDLISDGVEYLHYVIHCCDALWSDGWLPYPFWEHGNVSIKLVFGRVCLGIAAVVKQ